MSQYERAYRKLMGRVKKERKAGPPTFFLLFLRRSGASAVAPGCVSASGSSSSVTATVLGTFSNSEKVEIKTVTV